MTKDSVSCKSSWRQVVDVVTQWKPGGHIHIQALLYVNSDILDTSRFLMRKSEKNSILSNTPQFPILIFLIFNLHIIICQFQKESTVTNWFCLTPCSCHYCRVYIWNVYSIWTIIKRVLYKCTSICCNSPLLWQFMDTAFQILRFLVQQNTAQFSTFLRPSVRPFVRHRRDISTFFDILTVYTMKTIYFLNAYHLGW